MKKVDISVRELVGMIERGELKLPEMQRRYVWKGPRVRDLMDSLYRGYPSGSILVWETDREMPTRDVAVPQAHSPFAGHKLLLDGFNLDHPEGAPREFIEVIADEESPLIEEDEEETEGDDESSEPDLQEQLKQRTFVVASKALEALPNWVPLSMVFKEDGDGAILKKAGVTSFDDPRYARYTARLQKLRRIRDYPYVMHLLGRELDYLEVAEIFVRVNSLGVKLRGSDLALAQITARWPNSLKLLEAFQEECEERWFTLDLGLLVRAMVVFASEHCTFNTVAKLPIENLKKGWESAKEGLRFAINFLRSNADIEDESLLSSPFLFLPIAVYSQLKQNKLTRPQESALLHWLYVANAKGRYSRGSSETLLDEDLAIVFRGGHPDALLAPMISQFGRLHIEPSDLAGRSTRHPLFSMAFLALKAAGAKDWDSRLAISLTNQGRLHFIQHHHIFPKSLLKKAGYEKAEINEIANMAIISGGANRRISNKEPALYFPEIIRKHGSDEPLRSQVIPLEPELLRMENYRKFLQARRVALAELINRHIQSALIGLESV